jgi:AraC family transcriptional regulator, regulatory protein of adaptative response / methylated-DNA-[protein]-cysteine methyltransferase
VLDAAYAVGLSGPGRLHDLIVTLEAVTPGELKARGFGLTIRYGFTDTPFGRALIASTARGVCHLGFPPPGSERNALAGLQASWPRALLRPDEEEARALARRIWSLPLAAAQPSAVKLAVKGTNFQLKVWQALLEVGSRGPTTYSALARAAGVPGSERAVGNAVGANPVAWLIPCHNVLRKDGELGGYHWGADRKRAMLAWLARDIIQAPPSARASARESHSASL